MYQATVGRNRIFPLVWVTLACIASAYACGGDTTEPPPPDPPRPTTVTVSPATAELTALGATVQLTAEVRDQSGQVMGGVTVTWASNSTAVATVNGSGLVTAAGNGTATITATAGSASGSATVTVAQRVSTVEVTPAADTLVLGDTLRLVAEARDANGHGVAGAGFSWASSDTTVAVVDGTGLVAGVAVGEVEVSATSSGVTGRAQLVVVVPAPTTVAVTPDTVVLEALGDTVRLTAEVRDQIGRPMPDEVVTWASSDPQVAPVDSAGLVTALGNGTATITATSGAISGSALAIVMQVARSVTVSPSADTVVVGDTLRMTAQALDANRQLVAGAEFAWSSSDESVATVDTSGLVRGVGEGNATIAAVAGSAEGTAKITVFSPDRAPLVALYHATNGPDWVDNENWLTDTPLANWYGVDTDGDSRVVGVNLSGRFDIQTGRWIRHGLKGAIPPQLGSLVKLEGLWLHGNELSGTIPPELGNLAELEGLGLYGNELSGTMPAALGSLAKLQLLWVSSNELSGTIPPELGSLMDLTDLDLRANSLTGAIPPELGSLAKLQRLWLSSNELSGTIPPELGSLMDLTDLDLGANSLTGAIPPELGSLAKLESLRLPGNEFSGTIPPELGNLMDLTDLDLGENSLTGAIPPELGSLAKLEDLWLYGNELSGTIPPELGDLADLEQLLLSGNSLTGPIPSEFGSLVNLTILWLGDNDLTGPIPSELGNLARLTDLQLHENALTGGIPTELGRITSLETLTLRANNLTGPIPPEFGSLTSLTRLELNGNALTGQLPPQLGDLTRLERLLLANNELAGPLPSEFGGMTALQELTLTNNAEMAGALPAELTALTRLEVFLAGGTDLCVPSEAGFATWLDGVYRRRIALCLDVDPPMAYLTQAVQSREFPVPLVAGEQAFLRVFVTAREATRQGIPAVRARFYLNDRETYVTDILGKRSPIPVRVDESSLARSANIVIPGNVIVPGLEMVIEVDPDGTLSADLGVAKRIPETGRLKVDVRDVPLFDLTLIPFLWSEDPDRSIVDLVMGMAADPANHELLEDARTLLPVADLDVSGHEPVVTSTNNAFELLRETGVIRAMEGGRAHYMGMMTEPVTGAAGVANRPGRTSFSIPASDVVAHELGHNMSLAHSPCGGPDDPDPSFPYSDGSIGAWGYDFRDRSLVAPSTPDLMSNCSPPGISDYHFANALRFRLGDKDHSGLPDRSLLLWGGVDADGAPFLEPAFVVDAPALLPEDQGEHRITGRTADNAELFSLSFAMPEVADGGGSSAFAFAVPVQSSWVGALASITLSGPGGSLTLDADSDRAMTILRNPRSGQVRGILRDLPMADGVQVDAMAVPGAGEGLEILFSRGIPDAAAWRR